MRTILILLCLVNSIFIYGYSPDFDHIYTRWAKEVTPENVWQSYPRPQLKRAKWQNLNGMWKYAVTDHNILKSDVIFEKEILVPFAIESALSGVAQPFMPTDKLWYKREFKVPSNWKNKEIILHFGGVDYDCTIWIDNKEVGRHLGGNNPFSFNITQYLNTAKNHTIEVSVIDPTDTESISRGKQLLSPRGIWYNPVSGIWKTVWIEPVEKGHIKQILPQANLKNNSIIMNIKTVGINKNAEIKYTILDEDKIINTITSEIADKVEIPLKNPILWTPKTPKLYHFIAELSENGKIVDRVKSYFAMRKITTITNTKGYKVVGLNGKEIFQLGTLDQGWWPDGLLTPPSEKALLYDLVQNKRMGFNTLRKHIKVEPEIYYYYADSLGLMVWQDMVSGYTSSKKEEQHLGANSKKEWDAPQSHRDQWEYELFDMIDQLRFYPSITTWTVYNEGWGQYNSAQVVDRVVKYDTTRIINGYSGWVDKGNGHMRDIHNYQSPSMVLPSENNERISVLGEFGGGFRWKISGNIWDENTVLGARKITTSKALFERYHEMLGQVSALKKQGLAAAILTQLTDVEVELNGLMTYDREITKIKEDLIYKTNKEILATSSRKTSIIAGKNVGNSTLKINNKLIENNTPYTTFDPLSKVNNIIEFEVKKILDGLSIWLLTDGIVTVQLNGRTIFNKKVGRTHVHYQQYDLSNYSKILKKGTNTLKITVDGSKKPNLYDCFLTAY